MKLFYFFKSKAGILWRKIRRFFGRRKFLKIEKDELIISKLIGKGFNKIKRYNFDEWKIDSNGFVFFYLAINDCKQVFLKVSNNDKVSFKVSSERINSYNFDFVPKFSFFQIDGLFITSSPFINHFHFLQLRYKLNKKNCDLIISQINKILDKFYENKIIHFDFVYRNILIEKKTFKVYIIDFDSMYYGQDNFHTFFEAYIRRNIDNCYVYDDAYSAVWSFKLLKNKQINHSAEFDVLKSKIDRLTFKKD